MTNLLFAFFASRTKDDMSHRLLTTAAKTGPTAPLELRPLALRKIEEELKCFSLPPIKRHPLIPAASKEPYLFAVDLGQAS